VEVQWRTVFEVPTSTNDALLTTLHQLLENVPQTVDYFEISCLGAPFPWLEKPRNHMGRDLNWILCSARTKWIGGTPLEPTSYSPDLAPMRFLGISNHEKGAPRQEISKWSTVCSKFSRSGWSVVRSASLTKGGTSKKRPLSAPPQSSDSEWVHEMFKRPSYVCVCVFFLYIPVDQCCIIYRCCAAYRGGHRSIFHNKSFMSPINHTWQGETENSKRRNFMRNEAFFCVTAFKRL
jgi:hypothetical protein